MRPPPVSPLLEIAAARIELHGRVLCEALSLRMHGPRAVVVGDVAPVLSPLFSIGEITHGWVKLLGKELSQEEPSRGMMFLDPPLPRELTPREYVTWAARLEGIEAEEARVLAVDACEQVGLAASAERRMSTLSLIELRLVCLAQAVVHRPAVLVVEHPTARLERAGVERMIAALGAVTEPEWVPHLIIGIPRFEPGSALEALARWADELAMVLDGEVTEQGSPQQLEHAAQAREQAGKGVPPGATTEPLSGPSSQPAAKSEEPFSSLDAES